ncbi:sugar transferase [Qipengyuania oceanensis]|uniref:Sugar transferase n=1 Tax=Qipengyuania oceanensis TaxID=1463597 RepID=A0A844YG92_9SPHN|nr:sugar transferase [Qipengyuania oceanensis]MXO62535.1 sugar transferase [Qipengyuania oceanensis]
MAATNLDNATNDNPPVLPPAPLVASALSAPEEMVLITPGHVDAGSFVSVASAPAVISQRFSRTSRVIDIVGATALLLFLLPFMLVLAVATFLSTAASPIFAHTRVGRNGRPFGCYKFRTMYPDAEERLRDLLASDSRLRREWEAEHKLRNDPRVTRLGRIMRVTSLDELPQLLNVIKGEMSLVGPRPIVTEELPRYGRYRTSYLALRPGLTGLWQVSGRSGTTYRRRVATDHVYALNKCLTLDLRIIFATIPAVLRQRGAC